MATFSATNSLDLVGSQVVTGGLTIGNVAQGAEVTTGLKVTTGGVTVDTGGLTVTAGGATVTAGGLTVSAGAATVPYLSVTGLGTDVNSGARFVGATTSAAPIGGTYLTGDFVIGRNGSLWICTSGGSPGTWTQVSGGSGASLSVANTWTALQTFSNGEITIGRTDTGSEGGQINLNRSTDNTVAWYIDVYGSTSTPMLRFFNNTVGPAAAMGLDGTGKLGIGTFNPNERLEISGNLRLNGSTSGYVVLAPATNAGSTTYTLPSSPPASNGYVLSSTTGGTMSWIANGSGGGGTTTNSLTIGTGLSGTSFNGSAAVTIALANTSVTAGSYTNSNITVDAQGRITAASSGSAGGSVSLSAANTWTGKQTFSGGTSIITAVASNAAPTVSVDSLASHGEWITGGLGDSEGKQTVSWSHTVGNGSRALLVVSVTTYYSTPPVNVSYNNIPLTLVQSKTNFGGYWHYFYALVNPPAGTFLVTVLFHQALSSVSGSASFFNVDLSNPFVYFTTDPGFYNDLTYSYTMPNFSTPAIAGSVVYTAVSARAFQNFNAAVAPSIAESGTSVITGTSTPVTLTRFREVTSNRDQRVAWYTSTGYNPGVTSSWSLTQFYSSGQYPFGIAINSVAIRPYGSSSYQPQQIFDTIIPDNVAQYFDGAKTVFTLRKDQISLQNIVNSHDAEVIINGRRISPYIKEQRYPWFVEYDSFRGFRIKDGQIILFNAPRRGDDASVIIRSSSSAVTKRTYPFSSSTIALGE